MKTGRIFLYTAFAALAACRVEIDAPVEGSVTTQSGAIDCAAGQHCSIDVVDTFFDETFEAEPAEGWIFSGWKEKTASLCAGKDTPCRLHTSIFAGVPAMEALLRL